MNFKAGDKVVCVDDRPHTVTELSGLPIGIEKGKVCCVSYAETWKGSFGISLIDIHLPPYPSGGEFLYLSSRFRLVSEVQLCVQAVNAAKKRKSAPVPA